MSATQSFAENIIPPYPIGRDIWEMPKSAEFPAFQETALSSVSYQRDTHTRDIVDVTRGFEPASEEQTIQVYSDMTDLASELIALQGEVMDQIKEMQQNGSYTELGAAMGSLGAIDHALKEVMNAKGDPVAARRATDVARLAKSYAETNIGTGRQDITRAEADMQAEMGVEVYEKHLEVFEQRSMQMQRQLDSRSQALGIDTLGFDGMRNKYAHLMQNGGTLSERLKGSVGVAAAQSAQAATNSFVSSLDLAEAYENGSPEQIKAAETAVRNDAKIEAQAHITYAENAEKRVEEARARAIAEGRDPDEAEQQIRRENAALIEEAAKIHAEEAKREALERGLSEERANTLAAAVGDNYRATAHLTDGVEHLQSLQEKRAKSTDPKEQAQLDSQIAAQQTVVQQQQATAAESDQEIVQTANTVYTEQAVEDGKPNPEKAGEAAGKATALKVEERNKVLNSRQQKEVLGASQNISNSIGLGLDSANTNNPAATIAQDPAFNEIIRQQVAGVIPQTNKPELSEEQTAPEEQKKLAQTTTKDIKSKAACIDI
ncbi:MAG: hypothetical protein CMM93_08410 [Rickettsiales bacterium]|nr:hypothetical protein [Rickettsiales bacterium]